MTTIAIIDNQHITRIGLRVLLKTNVKQTTVLESESIGTLNQYHQDTAIDLIILGLNVRSDMSGVKLLKHTKNLYPFAPVILYDQLPDTSSVIRSYFAAGLQGYLIKESSAGELLDCTAAVLKGRRYLCTEAFDLLLDERADINTEHQKGDHLLSKREYEIAVYISNGMKTNTIAEKLELKPSTVSTIKSNIFKKLEIDDILKLRQIMLSEYNKQAS
jgi:DNA-binding NarL/FixJ family response regulator